MPHTGSFTIFFPEFDVFPEADPVFFFRINIVRSCRRSQMARMKISIRIINEVIAFTAAGINLTEVRRYLTED